jgi:hypothetical protein
VSPRTAPQHPEHTTSGRRPRTLVERLGRWLAALAMAGSAVSCGLAPDDTASAEASAASLLESTIAAQFEGVQLDVWGGGQPSPGSTTTAFVHHGSRAAEMYWKTDGWCLARVYTWSVQHAVSEESFTVRYEVDEQFTDCVVDTSDVLELNVFDVQHDLHGATYFGAYPDTWTVRTQCTATWNSSSPCGFADVAALVPEM